MLDEKIESFIFLISLDPLIDVVHLYNIIYMIDFYYRRQFGRPLFGFTYEERSYGMYPCEIKGFVHNLKKNHILDPSDGYCFPLRESKLPPEKKLFIWAVWSELKDMGRVKLTKRIYSAVKEMIAK